MIQKQSDDPNVSEAASKALDVVVGVLGGVPKAEVFDYGGHLLKLGEYDVCTHCTQPIAEAQAAEKALKEAAEKLTDETVKEHVTLAAQLYHLEAEAAIVRAEFHNGHGTEAILNRLLAYEYERKIGEEYNHSHHKGIVEETPWNSI